MADRLVRPGEPAAGVADIPRTQVTIERWQAELLDLSKANRLLHFKPGRGVLTLNYPGPDLLFARLVNQGRSFTFYQANEDAEPTEAEQLALLPHSGRFTFSDSLRALASLPVATGRGERFASASITLHPSPVLLPAGTQSTRPQHNPTEPARGRSMSEHGLLSSPACA